MSLLVIAILCKYFVGKPNLLNPIATRALRKTSVSNSAAESKPVGAPNPSNSAESDVDEKSRHAFEALRSGYRALLNAKSYRVVATARQPSGSWATFTYLRQRTASDGTLLRMDTVNYDAVSGKVMPHLSRSFIMNQDGNWEMSDFEGSEDVAFHVVGPVTDSNPAEMQNAFVAQAQNGMEAGKIYAEAPGTYGNQAVNIITVSTQTPSGNTYEERFAINPSSGALLYTSATGSSIETTFETNVDFSPDEFSIPKDKIITQSQDPNHDRAILFNQPTPELVPTELPTH